MCLVTYIVLVAILITSVYADYPNRLRRSLVTNKSIVDCGKQKRQANQYSCVLAKESTEGPFFIEDVQQRVDVRDGQIGKDLWICIRIVNQATCEPIPDAIVYFWSANAYGQYSGFDNKRRKRNTPTSDTRYLRGWQRTDTNGWACFFSIYPGWYPGRTAHLHVEVNTGGKYSYVGQLFYSDSTSDRIYSTVEPYKSRGTNGRIKNPQDYYWKEVGNTNTVTLNPWSSNVDTSHFTAAIDPEHESDQKWPE